MLASARPCGHPSSSAACKRAGSLTENVSAIVSGKASPHGKLEYILGGISAFCLILTTIWATIIIRCGWLMGLSGSRRSLDLLTAHKHSARPVTAYYDGSIRARIENGNHWHLSAVTAVEGACMCRRALKKADEALKDDEALQSMTDGQQDSGEKSLQSSPQVSPQSSPCCHGLPPLSVQGSLT